MSEPLERPLSSYIRSQFVIVDENSSVATAVKLMQSKKAETILGTSSGRLVGIVTDSDIIEKVVMTGEDSDLLKLKSVMSSPPITLSSSSTVKQAIELMRIHKIKHIPVTDRFNNKEAILGVVRQSYLAEVVRNSVLEKTFRNYRMVIRAHYKPIFANIGFIMQFAGVLMIVPALLGTILGELQSALGIYLAVIGMSLTGFLLNVFGERSPLNLKQSSIVVVSSFILLSLFGSFPYMYVNPFWEGIDSFSLFSSSFLESSSGFTTTGISTITHPENLPDSFGFYRSYTMWIGGLSFIYLIMALYYPETKLASMKNIISAGVLRFKQLLFTISIIFMVYATILFLLIYFFGHVNMLDSLSLAFSTLATGGFVPSSTILNLDSQFVLLMIMGGMIIAALPFAFHFHIFNKEIKGKKENKEIIIYLLFVAFCILLFIIIEQSTSEKGWLAPAFHVISASTTAGFQFINLSEISTNGKILLIIVMLIGGTAFSTAGGIKIARLLLIFQRLANKYIHSSSQAKNHHDHYNPSFISSTTVQFRKNNYQDLNSHSQREEESSISYDNTRISILSNKAFKESLFVIILYISLTFLSAFCIYSLDKNSSFINVLFESASTVSNNGLSTGVTSMDLDSISKLVLSINTIVGRFEIIAILYIFISKLRR